jgi:hypothetical protein
MLKRENLVMGFNVDINSPMLDCEACTEAKMTVRKYGVSTRSMLQPGEPTHIDLWGKYDVMLINRCQYYIVFVDDVTKYIQVEFLKGKNEVAQRVKHYLMHLKVHNKTPKYMRVDRGKEFINETLNKWCWSEGMEIQPMAPYSPAQNGVMERANRTLVELTCAMICAQDLPEFLWEYAVAHAVYLRNRAYTKSLQGKTPYEASNNVKPDTAHLHEFGAPVWILLQGQHVDHKILPKFKRRAFVGFEDGLEAVKYYSAETRKVLTSHNFQFLTLSPQTLQEDIAVVPMYDLCYSVCSFLLVCLPLPGSFTVLSFTSYTVSHSAIIV